MTSSEKLFIHYDMDHRRLNSNKKINGNHDFIESNIGFKTYHIQDIDMRNFDGKDQVTWILHMEQYFKLHNVKHTQKVCINNLYLEPNQFV